ncbi:cytidylyltransferase [Metarhizium robertsii]|uniref:choline-phosphate cytidylyltransferase n=2 Tax=Metarhizium robertsii TaxID=568076 RepID=E9EJG5_METRA|nr:phosphorylcholine transferase [Metarhizium robertsii ARSEF 23]EFZ02961.2 phosphorylcholine transferase [Metarhizium robertsii ARSEF 23]EXU98817.1 cytidylyltransferase [Metarhizium robertsii]
MSSPSASPQGSKRKRNTASLSNGAPDSVLQPSSRDASAEEGDTTAPESGRHHHRNGTTGPNPKRLRSNSGRPADVAAENVIDPGEPSDTTEASIDIAERVGRRARRASANGNDETMAPPPVGKLIHPAGGFKTNPPPVGRSVRVYADGVFDLFHLGHMRQLEQAKKAFPNTTLVVGVTGDDETHKRKGLTVMSAKERAESVRHCKWVDEVIEDCPWIVTAEFLQANHLDYVAHDDLPYGADEGDDIYQPIKAAGMFLVTQRTEGVSTTGIITRIVRDYEKYISRQFKRGTSRQELNVSWLKKNELDIKRHVQDLRDNIITNWTSTGQELSRELKQFWPSSRPHSPARFNSANSDGLRSPTNPGSSNPNNSKEFVTGYALGLVGGVRSWMTKNRRTVASRPVSDDESEESDEAAKSPVSTKSPSLPTPAQA